MYNIVIRMNYICPSILLRPQHILLWKGQRYLKRKIKLKSWPNDWLPFYWNRPEKIPGYFDSGDLSRLGDVDANSISPSYKLSQQLNHLPNDHYIRRIYTDGFASRRDIMMAKMNSSLNKLGLLHSQDIKQSMEAMIVFLTWKIRYFQEMLEESNCSYRLINLRTKCNSTIGKRNKLIVHLREQHQERCDNLCKILELDYQSPKIGVPNYRIERKRELRKLAEEYCKGLKDKKVEEFIKSMQKEQEEFEQEKQETLKWIEEQEKMLGITVPHE